MEITIPTGRHVTVLASDTRAGLEFNNITLTEYRGYVSSKG